MCSTDCVRRLDFGPASIWVHRLGRLLIQLGRDACSPSAVGSILQRLSHRGSHMAVNWLSDPQKLSAKGTACYRPSEKCSQRPAFVVLLHTPSFVFAGVLPTRHASQRLRPPPHAAPAPPQQRPRHKLCRERGGEQLLRRPKRRRDFRCGQRQLADHPAAVQRWRRAGDRGPRE